MDIEVKDQMTFRIDHAGKMSHCYTSKGVSDWEYSQLHRRVDVDVKSYHTHEEGKKDSIADVVAKSWLRFGAASERNPISSEEKYSFKFSESSGDEASAVIEDMLKEERQKLTYGNGSKEIEEKLMRR